MRDFMLSYVRNLLKTTASHERYWRERKVNWKTAYFDTWNHPHRFMISNILKTFHWMSLLEVGCGAGANLANIVMSHPKNKQLGGTDVNPEAIEYAQQAFQGAFFKVCPVDDIMMSDSSVDVILTDMTLIYVDPRKIDDVIEELKRIARIRLVLCEFHCESWLQRILIRMKTGYNAYDYVKLLEKHGLHDVVRYKIPSEAWPGGLQESHGYVVVAKIPRRKFSS